VIESDHVTELVRERVREISAHPRTGRRAAAGLSVAGREREIDRIELDVCVEDHAIHRIPGFVDEEHCGDADCARVIAPLGRTGPAPPLLADDHPVDVVESDLTDVRRFELKSQISA